MPHVGSFPLGVELQMFSRLLLSPLRAAFQLSYASK